MKRRFFFHYNKLLSQKLGKPQISIHYQKKCIIVDNIICLVPVNGKINKRQPFFVMEGYCKLINIDTNNCAELS